MSTPFIPHVSHLPLKIIHNFPYAPNASLEDKKAKVTEYLNYIAARGFGGVVSNVCTRNYLRDEEEWQVFAHLADECERLGLRLWLYDEDGYPSGGAGGLTIAENPDFEAKGIVMLTQPIGTEETLTIELPQGHDRFLFAGVYFYDDDGKIVPSNTGRYAAVASATCGREEKTVTLHNPLPYPCTICAFAEKRLYEGTHCVHNVFEARRYIDVTNPDAVAAFLRNTYDAYATRVPEHFHAGAGREIPKIGQIEAIFTDEPSFMGCYINEGLFPPAVRDAYDTEMPLYPVLSYGRDVANAYASRYGRELCHDLVALFVGDTSYAQRVRENYYALLSDLYETAFFTQISDWCARHDISFSGHLLLEDNIKYHTVFEGNYFNLLRHMHFPGIDMLHSIPALVRQYAFTPKLVSSVAHAYSRPHVMSEVSAHAQGGKVTNDEMYASLCAQYAMGVDIFTYYYAENFMEQDTYAAYNHALGRIDAVMAGWHIPDLLLYYPIEVFRRHHKPSAVQYGEYTQAETDCENHLTALMDILLDRQIDFDFADAEVISHLTADGAGRMISPNCEAYQLLLIPPMDVSPDVDALLGRELSGKVKVLTLTPHDLAHPETLINRIKEHLPTVFPNPLAVVSSRPHPGVLKLTRYIKNGKHPAPRATLLVNTNPQPAEVNLEIADMRAPVLYDPMTDTFLPCDFVPVEGGRHAFRTILEAYQSLIVKEA